MSDKCTIDVSDMKVISFKDKRSSSLRVRNNSSPETTVLKIQIDGCWNCDAGDKKCDYKLSIISNDKCTHFYIELKGGNYTQALEQIHSTLRLFPDETEDCKIGLIILSKVKNININSTRAQALVKKLRDKYNMIINHKCSPAEYCSKEKIFIN